MRYKKIFFATTVFAAIAFFSAPANAKEVKMIFWYPGEAGSTAEAQPVLDAFFAYINPKILPNTVSGKYFNSVSGGLEYLKKQRPAVGIISYAAYAQNKDKLGNHSIALATQPKPHGETREKYLIVGNGEKFAPGTPIISSEPLGAKFIHDELFTFVPADAKITSTPNILAKLKEIGEGKLAANAILTPNEAASLKKLTTPWAKNLKIIAESKPVPTARVVLFDNSWTNFSKFKAALTAAGDDASAREILDEMRLAGFGVE